MGYLLDQMEKIALANSQDNNDTASRVLNGVAGTVALGSAGGLTAMMPEQLETMQRRALKPMFEVQHGLTHTRGSEARRFLAQEKSLLRNAQKAKLAGDEVRATKLMNQLNSPMHKAWRGFKAHSLPGKLKLLAPVLGTAAGAAGLGTAGVLGINKALNG